MGPADAGLELRGVLIPVLIGRRGAVWDAGLETPAVCALVSPTAGVGSRRVVPSRTRWCRVLTCFSRERKQKRWGPSCQDVVGHRLRLNKEINDGAHLVQADMSHMPL